MNRALAVAAMKAVNDLTSTIGDGGTNQAMLDQYLNKLLTLADDLLRLTRMDESPETGVLLPEVAIDLYRMPGIRNNLSPRLTTGLAPSRSRARGSHSVGKASAAPGPRAEGWCCSISWHLFSFDAVYIR